MTFALGSRGATALLVAALAAPAATLPASNSGQAGAEFGNEDLELTLKAGHGVIYLWSPHMPLSIEGIDAIHRTADRRGLAVTMVLHPGSDPGFARRAIEALELTDLDHAARSDALRILTAAPLIERGMNNHAPSIQLYGDGGLVGPVLPGARGVEGYLEFIDNFAHEAAR